MAPLQGESKKVKSHPLDFEKRGSQSTSTTSHNQNNLPRNQFGVHPLAFEKRASNGPGASYVENWGSNYSSPTHINRTTTPMATNQFNKSGGVASARRFLWGDEEEESSFFTAPQIQYGQQPPKQRFGSFKEQNSHFQTDDRKSVNLMGRGMESPMRNGHGSSSTPLHAPSTRSFNWASHEQRYGDAADSGEAEEYIAKNRWGQPPIKRCGRLVRVCLSPLIVIFFVLSIALITRKMMYDNEDYIQEAQGNEVRFADLRDKLVEFSDVTLLDTNGTAQNNALYWLTYQDPANLAVNDTHLHCRYVLAVFFFSTSGKLQDEERPIADWSRQDHWMTRRTVCKWYGVKCEGLDVNDDKDHAGQISALNLTLNHVNGTIPFAELQTIPFLERIDLSQNQIVGTIPSEITLFPNLRTLYLRDNNMVGTVPSELGAMALLQNLDLGENQLSGTIPTELRQATRLRALGLDKNQLVGTIPELASLTSLCK